MAPLTIKSIRAQQGMTQEQLAQRAGVSISTIRKLEQGLSVSKPVVMLVKEVLKIEDIEQVKGIRCRGLHRNW